MGAIRALTFDTGGTILDWHGGVSAAFAEAGKKRGIERDWAAIANDYRRRSLKQMLNHGADGPAQYNIDDVHRAMLDKVIADHDLDALTGEDREAIWYRWHELKCWPDFPAALADLRTSHVVASFTILSTSLIVDTARANGLSWDAVISCEMIGIYKTRPEAYRTAAKWLRLDPGECMMVACHNFDLRAAREVGFRSAFVRRPDEWGAEGPPDPEPDPDHDVIADSFPEMVEKVRAL